MSVIRKNVKVIVLGDIGRSPRMQYHCLSLAEKDFKVDVIGYGETEPMDSIKKNPLIFHHYLIPVPQIPIKLLNYIFKTIFQALNLLFLLFLTSKTDILIVQNPPAIPALLICWFYTKIVQAKFIIDWHNYAHTIMALNAGQSHSLVKLTKKIETFIGRRADSNFCVTKAMKNDLKSNWNILATTLYDRPPSVFKSLPVEEKHQFLLDFSKEYPKLLEDGDKNTTITENESGSVKLRSSRPAILVSSTSWTEDEDFSMLLTALQEYEDHCRSGNARNLPKLICIITGKGPMKEYYLSKIAHLGFKHVAVITPWLKSEDYPKILACADLGVSLHTSSSGLDLPMKVVDMFGCGLPVSAHDFKCINELVKHGENSFVFKSSEELAEQILNWFEDFPNNAKQHETEKRFKKEIEKFQNLRWRENWENTAGPYFK